MERSLTRSPLAPGKTAGLVNEGLSSRPLFVVASDKGLFGYTVSDDTRSTAGASRE